MRLLERTRNFRKFPRAAYFEALETRVLLDSAGGTWVPLSNLQPLGNIENINLLTDGRVIANSTTNGWEILTPNPTTGSYATGTWSVISSPQDIYFASSSQILPNGNFYKAGAEVGTAPSSVDIYNPFTNTWTHEPNAPVQLLGADSTLLQNNTILELAQTTMPPQPVTPIFNVATNSWVPLQNDPSLAYGNTGSEQSAVTLPDGSVLTVENYSDGNGDTYQRYIPATNTWIQGSENVPIPVHQGNEYGPLLLLNNGKVLYINPTGQTALYTPSTDTWVAGASNPAGWGPDDDPTVLLNDGKVLVATRDLSQNDKFFYIYDPVANTWSTQLTGSDVPPASGGAHFLDLPDGSTLYASGPNVWDYQTNQSQDGSAPAPSISSITSNGNGTFTLSGLRLNGASSGAVYGDDQQEDTNYPIVRLQSTTTNDVYYATSTNWTQPGAVQTGSSPESVIVTLPLGLPADSYNVTVVASGLSSAPFSLTTPIGSDAHAPTVAAAASASAPVVTGTTTNLSVFGADVDTGETSLVYTWTVTAPIGTILPIFSSNGSNAAKNTTVTFAQSGSYTFKAFITDPGGLSVSSSVTVNVVQDEKSISLANAQIGGGQNVQLNAVALDQFGLSMTTQPQFNYSLLSGGGTITLSGNAATYTAPTSGTTAVLQASQQGTFTTTATVAVVSAPWQQTDVGNASVVGSATDTGGIFTVTGAGGLGLEGVGLNQLNYGDDLHFVYQSFSGDGTMVAHVTSMSGDASTAGAGVMIRESLSDSRSRMAAMYLTPSSGSKFTSRSSTDSNSINTVTHSGTPSSYWVELVRAGDVLTGYISSDGINWGTAIGTVTLTGLASTVYYGIEQFNSPTQAQPATFASVQATQNTYSLVYTQQPSDALVSGTIMPPVTITVENNNETIDTGDMNPISLTLVRFSGTGVLGGTTMVTPVNGVATFSTLNVNGAGQYALNASDGVLATSSSHTFRVSNAGIKLVITTEPPSSITAGSTMPNVVVSVETLSGAVDTTATGSITLTLHGPGSLGGTSTQSISSGTGTATFSGLFFDTASSNDTFTASSANYDISPPSSSFVVNPAAAATLLIVQQPTDVNNNTAISPAVTVAVEDSFGNVVTAGSTVSMVLHSGPGILSGTTSIGTVNGVATFSNLLLSAPGTVTLEATDGTLTPAVTNQFYVGPFHTLDSFTNTNGSKPEGTLVADSAGNLYGTTNIGGTSGKGTVFELAAGAYNTIIVLHNFTGSGTDGANPAAGLTVDSSGNLYGTTSAGGSSSDGTLFKIAAGTHTFSTLVNFTGTTGADLGANPMASLAFDSLGNLYGTTNIGGTNNLGTVFEYLPGSSTFSTLVSFAGTTNGANPKAPVVFDSAGNLYGVTSAGGANGLGVVYKLAAPVHHTLTVLDSFTSAGGGTPLGGLTIDSSGNLYGTTSTGGLYGDGTVFELAAGSYTSIITLFNFNGTDGNDPTGNLVLHNGVLYGTTLSGGTNNHGTVFSINLTGDVFSSLYSFPLSSAGGYSPTGLYVDASGNLFGVTENGGSGMGFGTIYELTP